MEACHGEHVLLRKEAGSGHQIFRESIAKGLTTEVVLAWHDIASCTSYSISSSLSFKLIHFQEAERRAIRDCRGATAALPGRAPAVVSGQFAAKVTTLSVLAASAGVCGCAKT